MHKLAELCVRRPVFATMLVLSLTVVGGYSFIGLSVDLMPNIDVPTVSIMVANPGASPEQIETEITEKIEGAVNTISGIDELRSTSVEGRSQVVLMFLLEKDGDVAAQEVRDRINLVIPDLPETALAPVIQKFDPGAMPILQIAVAGDRPLRDVTLIADERIKQRLENISGVGDVRLVGGAERQIQVQLDSDRMRAYNVTTAEVAAALRQQNIELPGGHVPIGAQELTVRTMGRLTDADAFASVAVATRNGYVVRVRDVGTVLDAQEELRTASFLNGRSAVTLVVTKQSGRNTVAVAQAIKERLAVIAAALPPDIQMDVVNDQSEFIRAAVDSLEHHLLLGSILASAVIFLFLANIRTTIIAAIAIPVSIISTFLLMKLMGYTLNQLTMLALTLMVGVVIDDAIIVLENIYRFIEEKGMSPFDAAIEATKEIGLAVMATTLSLMAVFVPVGFMGGVVGRFMSSFGLTAAFAIGVSLLVSFTLTPMLCSRFIPAARPGHRAKASRESWLFRPIDRAYMAMLRWSMAHRVTVVVASVLVVASIVPLFQRIGKNFVPDDDRSEFQVNVRTPEGSGLAATLTVLERMASDLRAFPEVTDTLTTVGNGGPGLGMMGMGGVPETNTGSIAVALVPKNARQASQEALMVRTREHLRTHYPATLRTSVQPGGGPGGGPGSGVQYSIAGPDLGQLARYSDLLLSRIKELPGAVDADSSLVIGKPELRVEIDRQRAADLGVRVQDVAQALNVLVAGDNVTTLNVGNNQYDVTLRADERFRTSLRGLEQLTVASSRRDPVRLGEVVRIVPATGPSSIQRLNRQRQVTLSSQVAPGGDQAGLMAAIDGVVRDMQLPPDYVAQPAGQSVELGRTASYFIIAISLSFIFMYIVLASQFESFIHPVTILLTLPLAVPFGILSLLVAGESVNVFAGLGLLLLFGIVKKNAILQIDHTNGLRAEGLPRDQAILRANRERLRPILMTTIALVAGMLPLVVSNEAGAMTNRSIGVLVAGGQTLCLLLTLLAVPVFYSLFDDLQALPRQVLARMHARSAAMRTPLQDVSAGPSVGVGLRLAARREPAVEDGRE
jgi:HAE1 family hydrophobic/amphiphilic exporter-1